MARFKAETGTHHLVFAIVNTRDRGSYVLPGDDKDRAVVTAAFGDEIVDDMFIAEGVTSRKRQLGPAIQKALEASRGSE